MKILIAGDWHAGLHHALRIIEHAGNEGIKHIIQLGDFQYFPPIKIRYTYDENDELVTKKTWDLYNDFFVNKLNDELEKRDIDLWFIDGNHENHEALAEIPVDALHGRRVIAEKVHHLPRGYHWTVGNTTFAAMGGAQSIDKGARTPGRDWFPGELITQADVDNAIKDGYAEIILTHEAPAFTPFIQEKYHTQVLDEGIIRVNNEQRGFVAETMLGVNAHTLIHGHYHYRYNDEVILGGKKLSIIGLGHEKKFDDNFIILDV